MKFGKQILANQVPGWSPYYLDYKFLKKIVSSLSANRPPSEAAALALGIRPATDTHPFIAGGIPLPPPPPHDPQHPSPRVQPPLWESRTPADILTAPGSRSDAPPITASLGPDDDRGPAYQAHKAAFFFKLERELEKINAFYLQKEAESRLRLETLMVKRRAAAVRLPAENMDDTIDGGVEWTAVEEGFRLLELDLGKLQQFIELNATGFRKILKKWDKRSKSTTKELYLTRQVDVQPVFNRQLISELSDVVATCLLDVTDISSGHPSDGTRNPAVNDLILTHQIDAEQNVRRKPFYAFEKSLRNAVVNTVSETTVREIIRQTDALVQQPEGRTNVTRILWKAVMDAPTVELADFIMSCSETPFDFQFVDDINGRTCLHEAAMLGMLRLVNLCLDRGVQCERIDVYGRSALHYACMNGHADVTERLIEVGLSSEQLDMDSYAPLTYAILRGHLDCARILLKAGNISVRSRNSDSDASAGSLTNDLLPLALACQSGHTSVVQLLLEHGATSLPNSNGEYPMHLAAREGHAEICRMLLGHDGWDSPDKYNEWTPLFHATRNGRVECIRVLTDAGCRLNVLDELGNVAIFYAAWFGHRACTDLLLTAMKRSSHHAGQQPPSAQISPMPDPDPVLADEMDQIPSLSLPPPIMPFRVYGHNFLDRNYLIQVSIGHPSTAFNTSTGNTTDQPLTLIPRISGAQARDRHLHASPFLKLVMTAKPDVVSAPYSISLPLASNEEREDFVFQVANLDILTLEFSIFPNFGSKPIGRAVAPPSSFRDLEMRNSQPFTLPIMDPRLHMVGEISFEVNVINPFKGVTLEIGGHVETYWKSVSTPTLEQPKTKHRPTARHIGSTQTSPSSRSVASMTFGPSLTLSSLQGDYVYAVIQVTRDLHPVVCPQWRLPLDDADVGVADVTLAQFELIAAKCGRDLKTVLGNSSLTVELWRPRLSSCFCRLDQLLKAMPPSVGLMFELALPPPRLRAKHMLGRQLDLNDFVDSVLRVVYDASSSETGRRKIVFSSFTPEVCAAVNWKQPNYPVFFASHCGEASACPPSPTAFGIGDASDRRLSSLGAAVEFAKSNNLLGVLLDAGLLVQVPSLIHGVRGAGLLVGAYGLREHISSLSHTVPGSGDTAIDAIVQNNMMTYTDNAMLGGAL